MITLGRNVSKLLRRYLKKQIKDGLHIVKRTVNKKTGQVQAVAWTAMRSGVASYNIAGP